MRIALSKLRPNYADWLRAEAPGVEIVDLFTSESPDEALASSDGLLLTGGEDIDPRRYARPEDVILCTEMDPARDAFEAQAIESAQRLAMPILGICRGEQMLNVAFGGSLFADIESQNDITKPHGRHPETKADSLHGVNVFPGTLLSKIIRTSSGEVNSAHHQAVRAMAPELRACAVADDGTIEAVEWKNPAGKPFLLAVQWHPERMDLASPFSINIARHFLFEAAAYAATKESA